MDEKTSPAFVRKHELAQTIETYTKHLQKCPTCRVVSQCPLKPFMEQTLEFDAHMDTMTDTDYRATKKQLAKMGLSILMLGRSLGI